MKDKKSYSSQFEAKNLLGILIKYWKPISLVGGVAFIVSALISLSIQEKYESSITLFPTSSTSVSKSLLSSNYNENELLKFGEEEEVEQMIQVLRSNTIRNKIIDKFNLVEHYNIDTNSKYPVTSLYKEFDKNININRTEFMSVEVEVLDGNPDTAASIANEFGHQLDSVMNNMQKERAAKAFKLVKDEYLDQKNKVERLQNVLNEINKKGIVELESQSEVFSEQYAKAIANGNKRGADILGSKLDTLSKYSAEYSTVKDQIEAEIKKLSELESKYVEAHVDLKQNLPHKYIVDSAVAAEKKSYPIRWLIVLLSVMSSVLLSMIILIFIENKKKKLKFNFKAGDFLKWRIELPNYNTMENYFKNNGLLKMIIRWKYHLIVLVIIAGGLGVLFSSSIFIKPKYESYAVLYPFQINPLSEESETEQMLEWLKSMDLRFMIYEAFDLDEHYKINPDDPEYLDKLNGRFENNLSISKTANEAVRVSILDTDPQMASDMVDSMIAYYNDKVLRVNKDKSKELVKVWKMQVRKKKEQIDSLSNVLHKMRTDKNMINQNVQLKVYSEAINNGRNLGEARENIENWKEFGQEYLKTDTLLWKTMEVYFARKTTLETTIKDTIKEVTYAHVVSKPFPADKKAYPVRWLIVLLSMFGGLFAGIVVLIFIDRAKISRKQAESE